MPAELSFAALGTTATLLVDGLAEVPDGCEAALRAELDTIDRACSRFRPDSELSELNARAGQPVEVSALFLEALMVALRAAELTGGKVDPTVGVALRLAGYDQDFARVAAGGAPVIVQAEPVAGWRRIEVDATRRRVRVPAGVALDLGATAKALAADRAAAAVATAATTNEGGTGVLVSLGGDIAVAGQPPAGGWRVHIAHNHADPTTGPGPTVAIETGGLATSSTSVRRWQRGGQPLHHLIDPSTGAPAAEHWRTVTVAAGCCVDANTASTAAIILGADAPGWLAAHGLPARLVAPGGRVTTVAGWPLDGA